MSAHPTTTTRTTITVELPLEWVELLNVLATCACSSTGARGDPRPFHDPPCTPAQRAARVLVELADHAQQGVYRPGAWERRWIEQAFGVFEDRLEQDPDVRWHQRPRTRKAGAR